MAPGDTQPIPGDEFEDDQEAFPPRAKRVRMRDKQPLIVETSQKNKTLASKILQNVLTGRSQEMALFRVKDTYNNDASIAVLQKAGVDLLRLMDAMGLAKQTTTKQPP